MLRITCDRYRKKSLYADVYPTLHSAPWFSRSSHADSQIEESVTLRQTQPGRISAPGVPHECSEKCIAYFAIDTQNQKMAWGGRVCLCVMRRSAAQRAGV